MITSLLVVALILSGPLFLPFPENQFQFEEVLGAFLVFGLAILMWRALGQLIIKYSASIKNKKSWLQIIAIIILSLLFLTNLELLKLHVSQLVFYGTLCIITLEGISAQLSHKKIFKLSILTRFLATSSISYLSFLILLSIPMWEPVVVALAFGSLFAARDSIKLGYKKAANIFLLLPPTLIGALPFWEKLPNNYMAVILTVPLVAYTFQNEEKGKNVDLAREVDLILFFMILVLIGLRIEIY